ncbi:FkbM family methyltransferase [Novosphingobium terrae]|uniref:FkbM family methyltransferase n=1 Tax=Novosphingobium terrae TaxID=2726189 RepID=UPI001980C386|nr:FkbM family methyltransferase [Novosphingobium terrae]
MALLDLKNRLRRFLAEILHHEQRSFAQYVGDDTIVMGGPDGMFLYLDGRDASLTPSLLRDRAWEPAIGRWLTQNLRAGECFVDIGANIGFHALMVARHVGANGLVVGFEPQQRPLQLFKRSISANNMGAFVHAKGLAIGDREDRVRLGKFEHLTGSATLTGNELIVDYEEVAMATLPAALEQLAAEIHRACSPDAIKIDVEGFEVELWEGMKAWVREKDKLAIILEYSPVSYRDRGSDPLALLEDFAHYGFAVTLLNEDGSTHELSRAEWVELANAQRQYDLVLIKGGERRL